MNHLLRIKCFVLFIMVLSLNSAAYPEKSILSLLMIDDTACPYCELWDEEIGYMYEKSEEGKLAPLIRHHYGEKLPSSIILHSEPVVTPTFIILVNQEEQFRIEGYLGEEFFWSFLTDYIGQAKLKKNK